MHYADTAAERMLLALGISGHPEAAKRFLTLPAEMFTTGVHRAVAAALRDAIQSEQRIHPPMIATTAARRAGTRHKAESVSRFVTDIATDAPPLDAFDFYARQVANAARIRELSGHGQRLVQLAEGGDDIDADVMARQLRVLADEFEAASVGAVASAPLALSELLAEPEEQADWLVPNLLERLDRLMLTAFEGMGKSELIAQFAAALAGGVHPFLGYPLHEDGTGYRVLVVDGENPRRMVRRRYRRVAAIVDNLRKKHGLNRARWSENLHFELHPGGLDLGDARHTAYLDERIASASPDLVAMGPIYKLHRRDMNEEVAARELVGTLDMLRTRHQFAVLLEAHAPHSEGSNGQRRVRPVGSSLFLRWPEFGYGLKPSGETDQHGRSAMVQMTPWRGAREDRSWPKFLRHGQTPTELPWHPADAPYLKGDQR